MITGISFAGEEFTFEELCQEEKLYPSFIWSYVKDYFTKKRSLYSITSLLMCHRKALFDKDYEVFMEFKDFYPMLRGVLFHYACLKQAEGAVCKECGNIHEPERSFEYPMQYGEEKVIIEETPDMLTCKELIEYKTVNKKPIEPHSHHLKQLAGYCLLLEKNGVNIANIRLIYFAQYDSVNFVWSKKQFKEIPDNQYFETELLFKVKERKAWEEQKRLPFPQPEYEWECDYCPYVFLCKDTS